jgi:catechol 2,3-dioxygenase-like lactoylglutathione lyase family enzyme
MLSGIHHVTAITADAQKNLDFYSGVLGLRLVKLTVNFDDPGSYHLYYGDELGRPGTIITFFAWPGGHAGHVGPPQVTATAFAVPLQALDFWETRLRERNVPTMPGVDRFGERVLRFADPDGLQLEIIATANPGGEAWAGGPVATEFAIRGFHGVTVAEEGYERTARLLTDVMGFRLEASEENRFRYRIGVPADLAATVDLLCIPDARRGRMGAGVVHHVAFRTPDDAQQSAWHQEISGLGFNISPIMDRKYFHSIYYREPGGVLFEIATDSPGFTVDEATAELGKRLQLPEQYEPIRAEIEKSLPPVRVG